MKTYGAMSVDLVARMFATMDLNDSRRITPSQATIIGDHNAPEPSQTPTRKSLARKKDSVTFAVGTFFLRTY